MTYATPFVPIVLPDNRPERHWLIDDLRVRAQEALRLSWPAEIQERLGLEIVVGCLRVSVWKLFAEFVIDEKSYAQVEGIYRAREGTLYSVVEYVMATLEAAGKERDRFDDRMNAAIAGAS